MRGRVPAKCPVELVGISPSEGGRNRGRDGEACLMGSRGVRLGFGGLCAVAVITAGPAGAEATPRQVEVTYTAASGTAGTVAAYPVILDQAPLAVVVSPQRRERLLKLVVKDGTDLPVAFVLLQPRHAGGDPVELARSCGAVAKPVRLVSTEPVTIRLLAGDDCSGVTLPTRGSVVATFLR